MKPNAFLKSLSWLLLLNLLVKPVWIFFIDREVQNLVGYEAYGQYFAILNLSYVLFFISDAGLSNMLNQQLARQLPVNLPQLFRIKALLLVLYAILFCFTGWLTHISNWTIMGYLLLIQCLTSIFIFLRSIVTAQQYFNADAWFSITDKFLMLVICGLFLYSGFFSGLTLIRFLQIQSACTAAAVLIVLLFVARRKLLHSPTHPTTNLLRLTLPFAIAVLLMSVHYRLDGFLLERIHFHGALEAGIYAAAYRILDAANTVGYLGASFLVPYLARQWQQKTLIETTILDIRHGLMLSAIGLVCFSLVFAPWLENLLYHTNIDYNAQVIRLCIAVLPAYFLTHVYDSLFTANQNFRVFIIILAAAVALNIILNIILIPTYGALGCSIAALVSQYSCAVACYLIATKAYNLKRSWSSMLVYLLTALALCGVFHFARSHFQNVWIILAAGAIAVLTILASQLSFIKKHIFSSR